MITLIFYKMRVDFFAENAYLYEQTLNIDLA